MDGHTQEHVLLSNTLGLGQGVGVQQEHSPSPVRVGFQMQKDFVLLLSGHGLVSTHLSLLVKSEQMGQRHLWLSNTHPGLPGNSRHLER